MSSLARTEPSGALMIGARQVDTQIVTPPSDPCDYSRLVEGVSALVTVLTRGGIIVTAGRERGVTVANDWAPPNSPLGQHVHLQSQRCLDAYRVNPSLVLEHANIERATAQGGYGRRQLYELVQNGADALIGTRGRVHVVLTEDALYCANEGAPIDTEGVGAILSSHVSMKRGTEIGRFGLGFKSVLGVTDRPEFYCRSVSFAFDARESERDIRTVVPEAERYPTMRIARTVDPRSAATADPLLAEMMQWATTVVKLPGGALTAPWLQDDMRRFPAEFLLFAPHVDVLVLEDRVDGTRREVRLETEGDDLVLSEPGSFERWKVFRTEHEPSAQARADAGELSDRPRIPVVWAVPLGGRAREGAFWAFFPTESRTTLSGILNAPWKTNEDRQNLLPGRFNEELLQVAAELIAGAIPPLIPSDDPGRYLELLPARGREARNWADELIGDLVYAEAARRPCLPDQLGRLRRPEELKMAPEDVEAALDHWGDYAGRPPDWVHHSVERRDRAPRALRLLAAVEGGRSSLPNWLEALVADGTEAASAAAVAAAAALAPAADPHRQRELQRARIVLTVDGELVEAAPGTVFLPGDGYVPSGALRFVASSLAASSEYVRGLEALGIGRVDPAAELAAMLRAGTVALSRWWDTDWHRFWAVARAVPPEEAAAIIRRTLGSAGAVRVRTLSGHFRSIHMTLLPGIICPADGSRDAGLTIDTAFHGDGVQLLELLGAVPAPVRWNETKHEYWFHDYRADALTAYYAALPAGSPQPQADYLEFEAKAGLGPLGPLLDLTDEGRSQLTHALLDALTDREPWKLSHRTGRTYPVLSFPAPALWLIRREGRLETSRGVRPVGRSVSPRLREWERVLPVARCSETHAEWLGLPQSLAELTHDHWRAALDEAERLDDDHAAGALYVAAAERVGPPSAIRCRVGQTYTLLPPKRIVATADPHEFALLIEQQQPVIRVPQGQAEVLRERWGLRPAAEMVRRQLEHVAASTPTALADEFPALDWNAHTPLDHWRIMRCSDLQLGLLTDRGRSSSPLEYAVDGSTIYVLDRLTPREVLERLVGRDEFGFTRDDIDRILADRDDAQYRARMLEVRRQSTNSERLLAAVGVDALRKHLPEALVDAVEEMHGAIRDERLGDIVLAMYGAQALQRLQEELAAAGLTPPSMWAGSQGALRFVRDLGFPSEFAGLRGGSLDPLLEIAGPSALPELHDYQRDLADEVRGLMRRTEGRRALLALPTGAGKTRIAVQAIVEAIRDDGFRGPVLWVADREELCEQAVQSWAEVWHALGSSEPLLISRFWGGNDATRHDGGLQIVVATIQKLRGVIDRPEYEWLSGAECVVIDEAHGSIGPDYTALLTWVGLGRSRRQDDATLLGLTATPYRGTSVEETKRLVARYGGRRLDEEVLGANPERVLQDMGVLSEVDHIVLEGDDVDLTSEQLALLNQLRHLPPDAEHRLGLSVKRNRRLLDSIRTLDPTWPVLFFATSVAHAQTMAALLTLEGIPAAAVSSDTNAAVRRYYIDGFRSGRVRVLTNYGVLTQGFDAPATRAVYIARPTYSPNVYQQMIGRGLRGPKNGGKERCLIVNVADNVMQYGERLAFHDFDHLWTRGDSGAAS